MTLIFMKLQQLFIIALATLMAGSCKDTSTDGGSVAKANLSLGSYYAANGSVRSPKWTGGSGAGAVNFVNGERSAAEALAINGATASFLFDFDGGEAGDAVAYFTPADAVTLENSSLTFDIPAGQNGEEVVPVQLGFGEIPASVYKGISVKLSTVQSLLLANVTKGAYSITKVTMKAIGGEKLAGKVSIATDGKSITGISADEAEICVNLAEKIDCRNGGVKVPVYLAPVKLSQGYELVFTCDDGSSFSFRKEEAVEFPAGGLTESEPAKSSSRKILACGSDKVFLIDTELTKESGHYSDGVIWSWSSNKFDFGTSADHIDDCKIVNDGKQFLVTCSNRNAYCAVVDYPSGEVSYYVEGASNAHSSELLPGDRLVVASSDGGDELLLYQIGNSKTVIGRYPLTSAHGVVWSEKNRRLYAIGGTSLQIYSLVNWDSATPSLKLEKTVSTSGFVTGLHDALLVNDDYITVAGNKAALFNMKTESFENIRHFDNIIGVKSLNYNLDSGEIFYTYAAQGTSEGDYAWSSHKIRYTRDAGNAASGDGISTSSNWSYIYVPDINMYKVRVYNW